MTATCATCAAPIAGDEHFRSAWHAFNLRRRTAELAPVSAGAFDRAEREAAAAAAKAAPVEEVVVYRCDACDKDFTREGPFETHLRSKKHLVRVKELIAQRRAAELGAGGVAESKDDAAAAPATAAAAAAAAPAAAGEGGEGAAPDALVISCVNCPFCFAASEDAAENLAHMQRVHSCFVPDLDHLADPEGLLEHLLARVCEGRCLCCKADSTFASPQAAQRHMIDRGHCRIPYESEAECEALCDFYEYSDSEGEEEGEGEGEGDGAGAGAAGGKLVTAGSGGVAYITGATSDLVTPSGRVLLNRHFMRYYSQYYRGESDKTRVQLERLALDYAAHTAAPTTAAAAAAALSVFRKAAALRTGTRGNAVSAKGQESDRRYRQRFDLATGLGMNDIRRRYFRVALLQ